MFIDNNWWGHKYVLSRYCNVKEKTIFGSLQHGVYSLEEEKIWDLNVKRNYDFIPFFCNSNFYYKKCQKKGIKNIFLIGSPFLYLDKIMPKIKKGNGTIVFPTHSSFKTEESFFGYKYSRKKNTFDHEGFIKNVEKYNSPPYTASIIKDDYQDLYKFYKRKNWKIFTAGDRYSKFFLVNIYKILSKNSHAVFSDFTSALYYAMFLGLKVRIAVKNLNKNNIIPHNNEVGKIDQLLFIYFRKNYPQIYHGKLNINTAKSIAKERMGYNFIKNKNELKNILGWNSITKNFLANALRIIYNLKYRYIR
jgi:hypothetical protein